MMAWHSGDGVGRINEVTPRQDRGSTDMGDHLGGGQTTSACNSASYAEREMSTGQSAVMLCGWGLKAGWHIHSE